MMTPRSRVGEGGTLLEMTKVRNPEEVLDVLRHGPSENLLYDESEREPNQAEYPTLLEQQISNAN